MNSPQKRVIQAAQTCADLLDIPVTSLTRAQFREWYRQQPDHLRISERTIRDNFRDWTHFLAMADCTTIFKDPEDLRIDEVIGTKIKRQQQKYTRKLENRLATETHIGNRFSQLLTEAVQQVPPTFQYKEAPHDAAARPSEIVAFLSDTHYGAHTDSEEVPKGRFNWDVAARRTAKFCTELARASSRCRTLHLGIGGDIVEGTIHMDDRLIEEMASQVDGARQILTDALNYLGSQFYEVVVYTVSGNHDRFPDRNHGKRVMQQKWNSHLTLLMRGLEQIFLHSENITFVTPKTPWCIANVKGHKIWMSHGDTVLNLRYPRKTLALSNIVNDLLVFEKSFQVEPIAYIIGHHHTPTVSRIPGSDPYAYLVVNGDLKGETSFGNNIGAFGANPCQVFMKIDETGVDYVKHVDLKCADEDESLHKIVRRPTPIGQSLS